MHGTSQGNYLNEMNLPGCIKRRGPCTSGSLTCYHDLYHFNLYHYYYQQITYHHLCYFNLFYHNYLNTCFHHYFNLAYYCQQITYQYHCYFNLFHDYYLLTYYYHHPFNMYYYSWQQITYYHYYFNLFSINKLHDINIIISVCFVITIITLHIIIIVTSAF